MNRFCTQCGAKQEGEALFCGICGAAFAEAFKADDSAVKEPTPAVKEIEPPATPTNIDELLDAPVASVVSDVSGNGKDGGLFNEVTSSPLPGELAEFPNETHGGQDGEQPPQNKSGRGTVGVAATVLSVVLAFVMFSTVTLGKTLFVMKHAVDNDIIKTAAKSAVKEVTLSKLKPFELIRIPKGLNKIDIDVDKTSRLDEVIYDSIDGYYIDKYDIEEENIQELLDQKFIKSYFEDFVDGAMDYMLSGEDGKIISTDDIIDTLKDNADDIEDITGYKLVKSDYSDIERKLKEAEIDKLTWGKAGILNESNEVDKVVTLMNKSMSMLFIVTVVLFVLLVLLIAVLNRKRISNVLVYIGIPLIVSGIGFIMLRVVGLDIAANSIAESLDISSSAITDTVTETANMVLFLGIGSLALGIVAVVCKIIFSKGRKSA